MALWSTQAFSSIGTTYTGYSPAQLSATQLYGMSRKARRQMEQENKTYKGRDKKFRDAIEDIEGNANDEDRMQIPKTPDSFEDPNQEANRQARQAELDRRMTDRPDVSTMYIDEQTGIEIIRQGRNVMDIITRKSVQLLPNPEYRLAQMFPGVPPEIRAKYRFNWVTVEVPEMVDRLREACTVTLDDGSRGIPPAPSVANKALDFCLANRDLLGHRMKKTLGKLMMRAAWQENEQEMRDYRALLQNFLIMENYISAPFRQILMSAETKVGPNFGNLDLRKYCNGSVYERTANYIVLKGMQCTWEKKVRDAEVIESTKETPQNVLILVGTGDPRRYMPKPEVLYELKDCAQVCAMAQKMVKTFREDSVLFDDLPVEIRFLESALSIQGGTALRKFIVEDFCPAEGISPQGLREGMRRLVQQLDNMYMDPYSDIRNVVDRLAKAMAVGTDDERNPYAPYLSVIGDKSPAYFETYTFNHHPMSLVRFLDEKKFAGGATQYDASKEKKDSNPFAAMFNLGVEDPKIDPVDRAPAMNYDDPGLYNPPKQRAAGRPHETGWLEKLQGLDTESDKFGFVAPGKIIYED